MVLLAGRAMGTCPFVSPRRVEVTIVEEADRNEEMMVVMEAKVIRGRLGTRTRTRTRM